MSKLYFPEPDNYASFNTQELHRSRGILILESVFE